MIFWRGTTVSFVCSFLLFCMHKQQLFFINQWKQMMIKIEILYRKRIYSKWKESKRDAHHYVTMEEVNRYKRIHRKVPSNREYAIYLFFLNRFSFFLIFWCKKHFRFRYMLYNENNRSDFSIFWWRSYLYFNSTKVSQQFERRRSIQTSNS